MSNLYVPGQRARSEASADPRDLALRDALDALTAGSVAEARRVLEAALAGTYRPEDNGEIPDAAKLEAEGLPPALAAEIGQQAKTSPIMARASLRAARSRLGIDSRTYLPDMARARAARGPESPYMPDERRVKRNHNPWLGREPAA